MLQSLLVFAMLFTEFFNEVDDYSTTSAIETMFDFKWDTSSIFRATWSTCNLEHLECGQ